MQSICGSLCKNVIYQASKIGKKNHTADKDRLKQKLSGCRDQKL